ATSGMPSSGNIGWRPPTPGTGCGSSPAVAGAICPKAPHSIGPFPTRRWTRAPRRSTEPEASPGATRQAGGITACSAAACTRGGRAMRNLMHRSLRRSVGAGVVPVALAACYSYTPLQTLEPVLQSRVSLVLSDQGRVGAGPAIGPGRARAGGALIGSTDSDHTLRVAGVTVIRGAQTRWSGETIRLQPPLAAIHWVNAVPDTMQQDFRVVDIVSNASLFDQDFRGSNMFYRGIEAGTREIKIFKSSSDPAIAQQVLTDMTFDFTAQNDYTFIHMGFARTGQTPAREVRVIPDNGADPGALNVGFRVIHAGAGL